MEYDFRDIEKKWQQKWKDDAVYKVSNSIDKPKFYVLDMFPYPSGAGLHVGHPLGYIASDIFSRYKRLKGFNVLHPMGYDSLGLPAEQYAIEHGIHPAVATEQNINNFRRQLDKIGFSYDWDRELRTSDPRFYRWTQWIFLKLFNSWYNRKKQKAESISALVEIFEKEGNANHPIPDSQFQIQDSGASSFSADNWNGFKESLKQVILMEYRLSYCGYGEVNWCEALGTVLANDEVLNGVSERGGYPVVKRKLRQWYLRITEYADRLLEGLNRVEFSESMKEMQTNWIGKSYGAEINFRLAPLSFRRGAGGEVLRVYTTRPDTIFGVDFMVVAPEHELVKEIVTADHKEEVEKYLAYVNSRSERERMAEKKITGVFTGSYAINPFNERPIPVWISEYVLAGYGTGAIMAVPCGDERDHKFAKHFNIPITNIIGPHYDGAEANPTKDAILENSDFINGMIMREAIEVVIDKIEELGIGEQKVNYKMRDAAFSRQRYWGEPFPIVWRNNIAYPLPQEELPVKLPYTEDIKPGPDGEGPLSNLTEWKNYKGGIREVNTMPGYAGSSWYFLRYMDPHNDNEFCNRKACDYWGQVDLYIGGTEHAVGHLLYSRMWTKVLYDLEYIGHDEPYKKLINQGMIQGSSRFVYRLRLTTVLADDEFPLKDVYISYNIISDFRERMISARELHALVKRVNSNIPDYNETDDVTAFIFSPMHVDVNRVEGVRLDIDEFRKWRPEYKNAIFICEEGSISLPTGEGRGAAYICATEVEKMSKSKFNTVNPDDIIEKYGADTFRMYEMFLGPIQDSKPWDTKGIEGVYRFLRKLWRLFADEQKGLIVTQDKATDEEWRALYRMIKKVEEDTERFSFNTAVSAFMIGVNDLHDLKCHKKEVLEKFLVALMPYAPHISEELWQMIGNNTTILDEAYPRVEVKWLAETSKAYPVAINGKTRTEIKIALDATQQQVEEIVLADEAVKKWIDGKPPKKVIYVKNKMINVVV